MKAKTITLLLLLISSSISAQQEMSISQYMFNGLFLNPAYAGSHDYMTASATVRSQWVKFEGAPQTGVFGIDGRLRSEPMGLGLTVSTDKIGITTTNEIYGIYSFHIRTGVKSQLSFGVKAGIMNFQENMDHLIYWDNDQVFANNTSMYFPKFGFGMYYYSEKYYAGFSAPTLLAYDPGNNFNLDIEKSTFLRRHYYLTGGYIFEISEDVKLKPFALVKYVHSAPLQIDLNLSAVFLDRYWIGAGYRMNSNFTGLLMLQINDNLRIGYAYDLMHAELSKFAGATHEVHIGWDFGGHLRKIKSVRYF
jgi:type IX secretion system PorP/SprF family membrane protein